MNKKFCILIHDSGLAVCTDEYRKTVKTRKKQGKYMVFLQGVREPVEKIIGSYDKNDKTGPKAPRGYGKSAEMSRWTGGGKY